MVKKILVTTVGALVASALGSTVYLSGDSNKKDVSENNFQKEEYFNSGKSFSSAPKLGLISLEEAIQKADDLCQQVKDESGSPGLLISVSIDGHPIYSKGIIN